MSEGRRSRIDREQLGRWIMRALRFGERDLIRLRRRLQVDSNDLEARGMLLGCAPEAERQAHALWFIEHEPRLAIAIEGLNCSDNPLFPLARRHWLNAVARLSDDVDIFRNATLFFFRGDPTLAESLLQDALKCHPDSEVWVSVVAQRYDVWLTDPMPHGDRETRIALQALTAHRQAFELSEVRTRRGEQLHIIWTLLQRRHLLESKEQLAILGQANRVASRALRADRDWGDHLTHHAFGLAALALLDRTTAITELSRAMPDGIRPGRPAMDLAKALLAQDETAVVIEYLDNWARVVPDGHRLREFAEAIRRGDGTTLAF